MMFVNVYEVTRCFGGHEEGGWWYDWYECKLTVPAEFRVDAEKIKAHLESREEFSNEGRRSRYSVIGDSEFEVFIEDEPAEFETTHRPHYE